MNIPEWVKPALQGAAVGAPIAQANKLGASSRRRTITRPCEDAKLWPARSAFVLAGREEIVSKIV